MTLLLTPSTALLLLGDSLGQPNPSPDGLSLTPHLALRRADHLVHFRCHSLVWLHLPQRQLDASGACAVL